MGNEKEIIYKVEWIEADNPEANETNFLNPCEVKARWPHILVNCHMEVDDGLFSLDITVGIMQLKITPMS